MVMMELGVSCNALILQYKDKRLITQITQEMNKNQGSKEPDEEKNEIISRTEGE